MKIITAAFLVAFLFSGFAHPAQADTPPCLSITVDQPHSNSCSADITLHPAPNLARPVEYDMSIQGKSHPRSVLFPADALPYDIGWIVRDWYFSPTPGAPADAYDNNHMVHKATLVYIYATVKVKNVDWHLIGDDRWIPGEYVAVLNIPRRPDGVTGRWITLDLSEQTLIAMIDDKPVFATLISTAYIGNGYTHLGLFHIYARTKSMTFRGPPWAKIPEYIIPHVPDVMFFDGNIGLHGAYWHDLFGEPLTHGCVNVPVGDEAWLWSWVSEVSDQWGPDKSAFFLPHPDKAPFVYVYRSHKGSLDGTQ